FARSRHLEFSTLSLHDALPILLAPVFGRLLRFFPPLVTGTVILIIGVSLLPVAGNWAAGGAGSKDFGAPKDLALAAFVLLVVLGDRKSTRLNSSHLVISYAVFC